MATARDARLATAGAGPERRGPRSDRHSRRTDRRTLKLCVADRSHASPEDDGGDRHRNQRQEHVSVHPSLVSSRRYNVHAGLRSTSRGRAHRTLLVRMAHSLGSEGGRTVQRTRRRGGRRRQDRGQEDGAWRYCSRKKSNGSARVSDALGGGAPRRLHERSRPTQEIAELQRAVAPLTVPSELVAWWNSWDPTSVAVLDRSQFAFLSPAAALDEWRHISALEFPRILLPICQEENRLLVVELVSSSHPGSRLFELGFHGENITCIGVGPSGLIDLIADVLERTRAATEPNRYPGEINWDIYGQLLKQASQEFGSLSFDEQDRTGWPAHWLEAEGFDEAWLRPKGRSHTVFEFDVERERTWPLTAVLQGIWRTAAGGGPLGGIVGRLSDHSGFVQVFIPSDCPHAGIGPVGQCEIEVVGVQETGEGTGSLRSSSCDALATALSGSEEERLDWHRRLDAAMRALDVSIVVTAVRPLADHQRVSAGARRLLRRPWWDARCRRGAPVGCRWSTA